MNEEYNTLRAEVLQKIELHNKLIMFAITTTVAILAFAFSQNNAYLFLLPFCVIIPVSLRVIYYRSAMVKISAYIAVFIEPKNKNYNWETRNHKLNISINNNITKALRSNINYDCLILSISCSILFVVRFLNMTSKINFDFWIAVISPILLVIIELILSIKGNKLYKTKQYWIDKWKIMHDKECMENEIDNLSVKSL